MRRRMTERMHEYIELTLIVAIIIALTIWWVSQTAR